MKIDVLSIKIGVDMHDFREVKVEILCLSEKLHKPVRLCQVLTLMVPI